MKSTVVMLVGFFLVMVRPRRTIVSDVRGRVAVLYREIFMHKSSGAAQGSRSQTLDKAQSDKVAAANRVTWVGVAVNLFLAAFKLVAGVVGQSTAMIADAGHSLSDLLSDGVTLWAVRLSSVPPDEDHPYGHGRFETLGALMIGVLLVGCSWGFGANAYNSMIESVGTLSLPRIAHHAHDHGLDIASQAAGVPGVLALVAAVVSIFSKEALFRLTAKVAAKLNSQVLLANAWHHRSDALSSIVALVGIVGSRVGLPLLDPLAGLCVAAMVALTGIQVGWDSLKQLTDVSDRKVVERVAAIAGSCEGVSAVDVKRVRCRQMGSHTLVDLRVESPPHLSASGAAKVAESVRWTIIQNMPTVSEVSGAPTHRLPSCLPAHISLLLYLFLPPITPALASFLDVAVA